MIQFRARRGLIVLIALIASFIAAGGCRHQRQPKQLPEPNLPLPRAATERTGDEIVVCGQLFDVGAPVVLWTDSGGYDMYDSAKAVATQPTLPVRRMRTGGLSAKEIDSILRDGWTIPLLRKSVDQFVIHYDVAGVSRTCFRVLKERGLGVQFMLDIDGTIYQTMDLQEQAPHATRANNRSIGVEIANMGAYSGSTAPLMQWYEQQPDGTTIITLPERLKGGGVRTPDFVGGPARREIVSGVLQGQTFRQYDYTPQQYESLIKLTAVLCTVFPKIQPDYPRLKSSVGQPTTRLSSATGPATRPGAIATFDEQGALIPHTLSDEQYWNYQGLLGHYHVQLDKQDPGPAFQWEGVIHGARALMTPEALEANRVMRGKPARSMDAPTTRGSGGRGGRGEWRNRSTRPATTQSSTTRAAQ